MELMWLLRLILTLAFLRQAAERIDSIKCGTPEEFEILPFSEAPLKPLESGDTSLTYNTPQAVLDFPEALK